MRLSTRSAWPTEPSEWSSAVTRARARRDGLLDLRSSNPTTLGLTHPPAVYRSLGDPANARYEPHALGLAPARAAVAEYYARRGREVDPQRIWLCASTSEAYAQLLTLLADPNDAVLVPRPGYPLLDMLGDLSGVRRVPYPLLFDGQWSIDLAGLDAVLERETQARVLVIVTPSNPTGAMLDASQWSALRERARAHQLTLVVDEVFADYPLRSTSDRLRFVGDDQQPCVVLSGLSKVAALPQLKLSWAVMHGPPEDIDPLMHRAELAADAFLSVATPVQHALPTLLRAAEEIQPRILARLGANLSHLRARLADQPVDVLPSDGGWTALLRLPQLDGRDDLGWAMGLLDAGVWVQPGFLYDLPAPPRIALSLLTPPDVLTQGMARLLEHVHAAVHST